MKKIIAAALAFSAGLAAGRRLSPARNRTPEGFPKVEHLAIDANDRDLMGLLARMPDVAAALRSGEEAEFPPDIVARLAVAQLPKSARVTRFFTAEGVLFVDYHRDGRRVLLERRPDGALRKVLTLSTLREGALVRRTYVNHDNQAWEPSQ